MTKEISIIVPVFNEEESLEQLTQGLNAVLGQDRSESEIVFVDDGSTDRSQVILGNIHTQNEHIKIIQLRKNYGKSAALTAGFDRAEGKIIVTIDADLQDDPREIPRLITKINEGYDVVGGYRKERKDNLFKKITSGLFNITIKIFMGIKIRDINTGLKAYRKEVVDEIELYGGLYRFLPVLAHQLGFRVAEIPVQHHPRKFGRSKYGPGKLVDGFLDLLTVILLTKYSEKPAHFFGGGGLLSLLAGFIISLYLTVKWFLGYHPIGSRPLFFLGILLLIIGIQLISLGLLGEMLVKDSKKKGYAIKKEI